MADIISTYEDLVELYKEDEVILEIIGEYKDKIKDSFIFNNYIMIGKIEYKLCSGTCLSRIKVEEDKELKREKIIAAIKHYLE